MSHLHHNANVRFSFVKNKFSHLWYLAVVLSCYTIYIYTLYLNGWDKIRLALS